MKRFYLFLAVIGAVVPYAYFIQHFTNEGVNLAGFVSAIFVNPAVSGFTADLLISSFVFWILMFSEYRENKGPRPLLFIVLNLLIGLSCALPAYLYARQTSDG